MISKLFGSSSLPSPITPSESPLMTSANDKCKSQVVVTGSHGFPPFLPKEVEKIKDPFARNLAQRMERLPVQMGLYDKSCIMSSCVRPSVKTKNNPVVLLHCFDSSCLEWRRAYPLLEEAGLEAWAIDVLGWGFSDLERLPPCNPESKRDHLYQFWKSYIKRPMVLVGPSLGASVAIDFAVSYPFAVEKLVLINASVYTEGSKLSELPRFLAYAGVSLLRSTPLRLYANTLVFSNISIATTVDWTNISRLHSLLPWWKDATVSFMSSGGYNVVAQIKQVKHKALVICRENDRIISYKQTLKLRCELPSAIMRLIPDSGHLPHVDNPASVANLIARFARNDRC